MAAAPYCLARGHHVCLRGGLQVYKFNVPTFGPGVVFDVDIKIRTEQIRFFTESLKTSKLQSYVPQFVMEAEVLLLCLVGFCFCCICTGCQESMERSTHVKRSYAHASEVVD